jgi:thiamine-phosphate pyrophosphorylase
MLLFETAPIICLVTDRERLRPHARLETQLEAVVAQAEEAGRAGVTLVQIRERDLSARVLTELTAGVVAATRGTRTKVVVNDRVDVALSTGADGVHLRGDSFGAARARALAPPAWIVGRSIHDVGEAELQGQDVDYVIFGTVFPTASKAGAAPAGLAALRSAAAASPCPVLAIGGVSTDNVREAAATGVAGVAAIELFLPPTDAAPGRPGIAEAVRAVRSAFGAV